MPEKWPPLEMARDDVDGSISVLDREEAERDYPGWEKDSDYEINTYIPVSALLSDEVVEAITATKLPGGTTAHAMLVDRIRKEVRADLETAIEQAGGGQG